MARSKVKTKPKLTDFERDSIWMSYRYCIGRSTIAAHTRACDIAEFLRTRDVDNDRLRFTAEDINKSIDDILRISYNFWYENSTMRHNGDFRPWMAIVKFIKFRDIKDPTDLSTYTNIYYNPLKEDPFRYEIDETKRNSYSTFMTIDDLRIWSDLAAWMDDRCHHIAHCKDEDGNLIDVKYFDSYWLNKTDKGLEVLPVKVPVDSWTGYQNTRIEEKYIISID